MPADEFEIIRTLFAPLAKTAGARGLVDDVAVLSPHGDLVVTTDALVEGVHFFADDPIETVAQKALRANLSDLAGKGAKAQSILLNLIWSDTRPSRELAAFARGLKQDLDTYGVALIGGDTTSTPGPTTLSITAFGAPLGSRTPSRADALAGEDVWVTGTIGDAWLGYLALRGDWPDADANARDFVIERFRGPQPRLAFAQAIARFASASMDVSDGLLLDAAKLAAASGVAIEIDADAVPLSAAARAWRGGAPDHGFGRLLSFGDDYEILFTAHAGLRDEIAAAARAVDVAATRIGRVLEGAGVSTPGHDSAGAELGHSHALGA